MLLVWRREFVELARAAGCAGRWDNPSGLV
jgi:hypothetical protein